MDAITINSIVVGSIAILSALTTTVLTNFYQSRDSNKKRKWELEDKDRENKQNITLNRINQIESLVFEAIDNAYDMSKLREIFKEGDYSESREMVILVSLFKGSAKLKGLGRILEDEILDKHLEELISGVGKFLVLYLNTPKSELFGVDFSIKLGLILNEINDPFDKIIKRLDYIKLKVMIVQH
jgi:hypothetical protein